MVHPGTMETFCRRAGSQDGGLGSLGAASMGVWYAGQRTSGERVEGSPRQSASCSGRMRGGRSEIH
jgi:hypothetical protein